ncbi:hypothetical protein BJ944DRAFT_268252 [Cunninghamella echinulata]|nr:hypothetical protein BJ944DRAFT_268252 [Cunninghamella echinulata]
MSQQVIVNSFGGIGPICILLDTTTQQTILDLKKHVTQRTSIPTTLQCIKNLSGRSLKDQDAIFMNDKEKGPIVFNIKIITSWKPTYAATTTINNNNNDNDLLTEQQQDQQLQRISKYIRQDIDTLNQNISSSLNNNNNTTTLTFRAATMIINTNDDYPLHTPSIKGKSKETRKRKSCE